MDILDFLFNFLLVTILGLLIAFSPMLVIVNVLVVLKSKRPILRTIVLMAGIVLPLVIIAYLGLTFIDASSHVSLRGLNEKISIPPAINLLFGAWLLGLAAKRYSYVQTHKAPKKPSSLKIKNPPDKLLNLFIFAFLKSTLSVTNLFAMLAITQLVIINSVKQPSLTLAIIWAILIGLIPFGIILYSYYFRHEQLEKLSAQIDALSRRNLDAVINLALATVGGFFFINGLIHLFSR